MLHGPRQWPATCCVRCRWFPREPGCNEIGHMEHHRNLNSSITPQNLDDLIDGASLPASDFYKKTWIERLKQRAEGRRSFTMLSGGLMIADMALIGLAGMAIYAGYVYQPGGSISSALRLCHCTGSRGGPVGLARSGRIRCRPDAIGKPPDDETRQVSLAVSSWSPWRACF
jgi:hypothetical protein